MEDPHAKHAAAVAIIRHIAADLYALADGGKFDARQWRGAAGELETAAGVVEDSTIPAPVLSSETLRLVKKAVTSGT